MWKQPAAFSPKRRKPRRPPVRHFQDHDYEDWMAAGSKH